MEAAPEFRFFRKYLLFSNPDFRPWSVPCIVLRGKRVSTKYKHSLLLGCTIVG